MGVELAIYELVDDADRCYRAVLGRDRRFDGVFYTGVRTTGIYCRPSCPASTPQRKNVAFFVTAAGAQGAGFRACRRCRPDLTPGSPEWDVKADVAGRAMRMIADGVVEREGVEGLASRAGYSSRHLNRVVSEQLGASPLSLARAQRAHTARILIETTDMGFADAAFAAGFASVRQFNATIQQVYDATPTALRAAARSRGRGALSGRAGQDAAPGKVTVSLAVRQPFESGALLGFLGGRVVSGVEAADASSYSRTVRLANGHGTVRLTPTRDQVACELTLSDLRDLASAVERCRRLLDLDADPIAIDAHLASDARLEPSVRTLPGLRVPGHVDGFEVAVRAVIGQQISVAGACTIAGRLAERFGRRVAAEGTLTHLFPDPEAIAAVDPETLPMPRARGRSLVAVAAAVAEGRVVLDRGADRGDVRAALLQLPGIGPWTADYIALRALGDPDVFLPTDLGVRRGLQHLGFPSDGDSITQRWRPWRSYALMHVWSAAGQWRDNAAAQPRTAATTHPRPTGSRRTRRAGQPRLAGQPLLTGDGETR